MTIQMPRTSGQATGPAPRQSAKYVYDFAEGNKDLKDLLGGKGANLAEMTNLGLPVPPGFTITTEACRAYLATGERAGRPRRRGRRPPARARGAGWARRLGDPDDPLLVSVRSGAKFSMPGHDGDRPQHRPQRRVASRAWRAAGRRRAVRLGLLPAADPDVRQDRAATCPASASTRRSTRPRRPRAPTTTSTSTRTTCSDARRRRSRRSSASTTGRRLPAGPARAAGPRRPARSSTRGTPTAPCSTAARSASRPTSAPRSTCVAMVFGNLGTDSGTGVAFTRDPATGARGRLRRLPAERAGRGRRRRHPQHRAAAGPGAASTSTAYDELLAIMDHAGEPLPGPVRHRVHHRARQAVDAADPGRQAHRRRPRSSSPRQLVDEGLIDLDEALRRVTGAQLAQLMFPRVRPVRRRAS